MIPVKILNRILILMFVISLKCSLKYLILSEYVYWYFSLKLILLKTLFVVIGKNNKEFLSVEFQLEIQIGLLLTFRPGFGSLEKDCEYGFKYYLKY
jgi:hypothetical protein